MARPKKVRTTAPGNKGSVKRASSRNKSVSKKIETAKSASEPTAEPLVPATPNAVVKSSEVVPVVRDPVVREVKEPRHNPDLISAKVWLSACKKLTRRGNTFRQNVVFTVHGEENVKAWEADNYFTVERIDTL